MSKSLLLSAMVGIAIAASVSVLYLSARSVLPELPKLPFITPSPQPEAGRPLEGTPTFGQQQGSQVKFETLGKAQTSEHQEEKNYVINTAQEWRQLWDKITGPFAQVMPVPVDFEKETVIAVFQGQRSSAGYTIEVTKILQTNGKLEVSATATSPGPSCVTAQVITAPYHLVKIQKFTDGVKFNVEEVVRAC